MFNLQGGEIVIILLLALVVLGPEKLPDAMRKAGKAYSELKKMSSGFQQEFRSVVDEPMREIRDTANVLRDSADFTKLQDGQRAEKPKSAEMAPVDPDAVPTDDTPTFETPEPTGPARAADSQPAPFDELDDEPSERPTSERTPFTAPAPFTGMSSAALEPETNQSDDEQPEHDHAPDSRAAASTADESDSAEGASSEGASSEPASSEPERESARVDGDR